jgi:hypothetical protein
MFDCWHRKLMLHILGPKLLPRLQTQHREAVRGCAQPRAPKLEAYSRTSILCSRQRQLSLSRSIISWAGSTLADAVACSGV